MKSLYFYALRFDICPAKQDEGEQDSQDSDNRDKENDDDDDNGDEGDVEEVDSKDGNNSCSEDEGSVTGKDKNSNSCSIWCDCEPCQLLQKYGNYRCFPHYIECLTQTVFPITLALV